MLFAIVGVVLVIFLIVGIHSLVRRCTERRKHKRGSKQGTSPNQKSNEKLGHKPLKPIIVPVGMRPDPSALGINPTLASPPNIMITPATASPSQIRFAHQANFNSEPRSSVDEHEHTSSESNYPESEFNGSEIDLSEAQTGHTWKPACDLSHQLSSYHSRTFSRDCTESEEGEELDEIDLQSPGESVESVTPLGVKTVLGGYATVQPRGSDANIQVGAGKDERMVYMHSTFPG